MNAFPSGHDPKTGTADKGMKLRDYIAAKAMQGLFAHKPWQQIYTPEDIAKESYQIADAMLKARDL
jgi:hypothetical protein